MAGAFDDLIPESTNSTEPADGGAFDDIVAQVAPKDQTESEPLNAGRDDLDALYGEKKSSDIPIAEKARTLGTKLGGVGSFLAGVAKGAIVDPALELTKMASKGLSKLPSSGPLGLFAQGAEALGASKKLGETQKSAQNLFNDATQEHPIAATAGEITGSLVGPGAVASKAGKLASGGIKAAGRLARVGKGAVDAATAGGTFGALQSSDSTSDKVKNIGIGVGAGAVLGGGVSALRKGKSAAIAAAQKNLVKASEKTGVPLSVGRVAQSKSVRFLQSVLEGAPVIGMAGTLKKNVSKLDDAIKGFVKDTGVKSTQKASLPHKMLAGIAEASVAASKEVNKSFQSLLKSTKGKTFELNKTKLAANRMLDDIDKTGAGLGVQYKKAYKDAVAGVRDMLQKTDLLGAQTARRNVDAMIESLKTGAQKNGIVRSQLGNLKRLRHIMEREIELNAKRLGQGDAYRQAKQLYQDSLLPFKNLKPQSLDDKTLPGVVTRLSQFAEVHPKAARSIIKQMTPDGRSQIVNGVFENALVKATDATKGFNNARFLNEVAKSNKVLGLTMTKAQKELSVGIKRMADAINGRSKLSGTSDIATKIIGASSIGFLTIFGGLPAAVGVGAAIKGLSKALSSPTIAKAVTKIGIAQTHSARKAALLGAMAAIEQVNEKKKDSKRPTRSEPVPGGPGGPGDRSPDNLPLRKKR